MSMNFLYSVTSKFIDHLVLWVDIWPILYILIIWKILVYQVMQIWQMFKNFMQYQKITLIDITTDLTGTKVKFWEAIKLTVAEWSFFKILIFTQKCEYYHWWQIMSVIYPEVIGSLHFWDNIYQIRKYLIVVFPCFKKKMIFHGKWLVKPQHNHGCAFSRPPA